MSEKLVLSSTVVWEHLGTSKEKKCDEVLSQNLRKPPLPQLYVVAKGQ